jgi:hypothetical protein
MELVPEGYVVEMKPVGYPNCPYPGFPFSQ